MNKLILFPLAILVIITIFWIMLGESIEIYGFEGVFEGSGTDIPVEFTINIDPIEGMIGSLIGIAVAIALIGIRILGSGLSEKSVHIISTAILYTAFWGTLSLFSYDLFGEIPIFGAALYILLTILYAGGAAMEFSDEGGDN